MDWNFILSIHIIQILHNSSSPSASIQFPSFILLQLSTFPTFTLLTLYQNNFLFPFTSFLIVLLLSHFWNELIYTYFNQLEFVGRERPWQRWANLVKDIHKTKKRLDVGDCAHVENDNGVWMLVRVIFTEVAVAFGSLFPTFGYLKVMLRVLKTAKVDFWKQVNRGSFFVWLL